MNGRPKYPMVSMRFFRPGNAFESSKALMYFLSASVRWGSSMVVELHSLE